MYFLFLKIINIHYKEDVFLALQSVGIQKGSFFESGGLDGSLREEAVLFSGFFKTDDEYSNQQIIVTALAESKDQVKEFLDNLKAAGIEIDKEPILRAILMPITLLFDADTGLEEF